jgi:GntR family transcriptional repressor for pyruvate dehydrogenase complex
MTIRNPFRTLGTKERLVDRVVKELEQLIIEGRLIPGTKLPPERDLAEQLGVSRTVVREAVRILVTKGLLETRHGVGTMVRQLTREQVVTPLNLFLRMQGGGEVSFDDLHQVRSILEIETAGLAASQATKSDIGTLKKIFADMVAAQNHPKTLALHDANFHSAIAKTTHNPLLIVLINSISDLLKEYIARVTPHIDPQRDNLALHQKLLERIEVRDVEGARQAMQENLDQMKKNNELYLKLMANGAEPAQVD